MNAAPGVSRRAHWLSALVLGSLCLALEILPRAPLFQGVSDWTQLTLAVAAALSCARAAVRSRRDERWFWAGIGGSVTLWACAQVRFIATGSIYSTDLDPLQSALFLSVGLPLLPTLALLPDRPHAGRARLALDITIAAVLAFFLYLYVGLAFPGASDTEAFVRWRAVAGRFQAVGLTLAFALRVRIASPPWRPVYRSLALAFGVWFIGDSLVTIQLLGGTYHAGLLDLPWMLPFAWIALIAASPPPTPGERIEDWTAGWSDNRRDAAFALTAVACPPLLHFVWTLTPSETPAILLFHRTAATAIAMLLLSGLFLLRQLTLLTALQRAERRRAERRHSSEQRFAKAFHALPVGALMTTLPDERVVDVNESCLQLIGFSRREVVGRTVRELDLLGEPDAQASLFQGVSAERPVRERPLQLRRRSGEVIEVAASVQPIETGDDPTLLTLMEDHREQQRLEAQILQSQKLEIVGRLAGAVAHDFSNFLTAILGGVELAMGSLDDGKRLRRRLHEILHASERAAALTQRLLAYGRGQAGTPQAVDLGRAVHEALPIVRRLIGPEIELGVDVDPALPRVRIEPAQFDQVLINLVVNARDAMRAGGRLRIGLDVQKEEPPPAGGAPAGSWVRLSVVDTGHGMSDAVRERAFEPFFTTKAPGLGSGIGLATVLDVARQSGGTVRIDSSLERGTSVHVLLPEARDHSPADDEAPPTPVRGGSETILLVEDEPAVRALVRLALEESGYRVIETSSGNEALAAAAAWRAPIDLLLTDIVMPGMSGPELVDRLAPAQPQMRVLLSSGYTTEALGSRGVAEEGLALIQKPFTPSALARRVRQVLDAPPRGAGPGPAG
jgi:PAS domain S-box-containing protein